MCGRYSLTAKAETLAQRFNIEVGENYHARYNAAPSQILPIITSENPEGFSLFFWGVVPEWSKNKAISPKFYNVRAEMIKEKTSLRNALQSRRCIIPADGFFEWKSISKKSKVPYRVTLQNKEIFAFAGLWEEYENESSEMVHTFTIITAAATAAMSELSDRMPVILSPEAEKVWLNESSGIEDLINVLHPAENIDFHTVSALVNSEQNDRPEVIRPAPAIDQFGNYTLFS
ncbi:MAG: SOS response-associated peptidase [Bacteroidota bacterium]|nr:SOS response-associated peptidase [Bacteroidota bacterium]